METLERRELLALAGVTLSQFPLGTYDATGVTTFDAATGAFDVAATPLTIRLSSSSPNRAVVGVHGDVSIHARLDSSGQLLGGVAGDDLVIQGGYDFDGSGTIDPSETGVLLKGEIYALGWAELGATDRFDFKFVLTEGLLAGYFPNGTDIGMVMTSESSTFNGSFTENFTGGAKGNYGPIAAPPLSSLAGTIYCDQDQSGSLTSGDMGLANVAVRLMGKDDVGNAIDRIMQTASDGTYSFTGLRPGIYQISETSPTGTAEGTNTVGTANGVVVNEDAIGSIQLPAGVSGTGYNFGYICLGSIRGTKFFDVTANGLTPDDTVLAGTTIYLDANNNSQLDPDEASTITGADGSYAFNDLLPGQYVVREVVPAGYQRTTPIDSYSPVITPGAVASNLDFANALIRGSISGRKFLDETGNGLTSDDSPLPGVVVYIDANNNGSLDANERSTTTGAGGAYVFENLNAGTYIIREVVGAGFIRTGPTNTDRYVVTLSTGQSVGGIDFANAMYCNCKTSITNITYSINGTCVVTDLRGNTNQGDVVTVTFTVKPGSPVHKWTLVSYTAPGKTFVAEDADDQRIYDIDSGLFGPGTYQLTVTIPDSNYQIDFVCGDAIDKFGPAGSNIFYSAQNRLISADNDGNAASLANPASISGFVWLDDDNDGVKDANEMPIQGAKVTVSWTVAGVTKSISKYTDADGRYVLGNLAPGVYSVSETNPSGYTDGKDAIGSKGGTLSNDKISGINLGAGVNANGYNFGDRSAGDVIGSGDVAALSFWKSTAGGNLIRSLNGGSTATQLGFWLADHFPALFGSGSLNLRGKSNSQIASDVVSRAATSSLNLETQVLATALSAYVTNSAWAGGGMASSYGFVVNLAGSGLSTISVGTVGSVLGFANNSQQRVLDILEGVNALASNGLISVSSSTRTQLFQFFSTLNSRGGIA
jgi:hypothetical protein